jgi:hypothetical protein
MTCPPCNHNCNEGRTCPARNKKYIEEDDDIQEYKRPWVGLTDEDLKPLSDKWRIVYGGWVEDFAKEIEAKLKEKNT